MNNMSIPNSLILSFSCLFLSLLFGPISLAILFIILFFSKKNENINIGENFPKILRKLFNAAGFSIMTLSITFGIISSQFSITQELVKFLYDIQIAKTSIGFAYNESHGRNTVKYFVALNATYYFSMMLSVIIFYFCARKRDLFVQAVLISSDRKSLIPKKSGLVFSALVSLLFVFIFIQTIYHFYSYDVIYNFLLTGKRSFFVYGVISLSFFLIGALGLFWVGIVKSSIKLVTPPYL